MSTDILRLENASAIRSWEEDRAGRFGRWRAGVEGLIASLRGTLRSGAASSQILDGFMRRRGAVERAYAQAARSAGPHLWGPALWEVSGRAEPGPAAS